MRRLSNRFIAAGMSCAAAFVTASPALAVFEPPTGTFTMQIFDGTNAYRFNSDTGNWLALPRPVNGQPPNIAPGDVVVTAYHATSFDVTGLGNQLNGQFQTPEGHTLTGIVSDLVMVGGLFPPVAGVGSVFFQDAGLISKPGQAPGTIGRFELWDNNVNVPASPLNFFNQPGGQPGDATGLPGAPTGMPDFQQGTLLMGGSIVPNFFNTDPLFGPIGPVLVNPLAPPPGALSPETAFTGSVTSITVLLDSGTWYDENRILNNLVNISTTQNIFDTDSPLDPLNPLGPDDPYFAGYQVNSTDPVDGTFLERTFVGEPIPEPATGGLAILALGGLGLSAMRRRRA